MAVYSTDKKDEDQFIRATAENIHRTCCEARPDNGIAMTFRIHWIEDGQRHYRLTVLLVWNGKEWFACNAGDVPSFTKHLCQEPTLTWIRDAQFTQDLEVVSCCKHGHDEWLKMVSLMKTI